MSDSVDFSFIRYANGWEDTELLLNNLQPKEGDKLLSIAASGDNSLSMLIYNPELVIAFDINDTQLYLTELKQKTIELLDHDDALIFLGVNPSNERLKLFELIKNNLSNECYSYFEKNSHIIVNGIIHQGKFENYFKLFRTYILPIIHNKKTINKLFQEKSEKEQLEFYQNTWNTWLWRALFNLFFSKYILGKYGRDPQFFKENKQPVAQTIFKSAEKHLSSNQVFKNYYLDFQLRGSYSVALPHYLILENFNQIKSNINQLKLKKGFLTDMKEPFRFNKANLSNIFEYMNEGVFKTQSMHLENIMTNQSKIAYWNLLVPRKLEEINSNFIPCDTIGDDLCFFYQSFNVNEYRQ